MISIVSAYHNRKKLLINTLNSITNTNDMEYIIVDDCSDEEHRVEDLCELYPFLKVIRLEKKDKWYINPCVVFNIGFKEAKGNVIILQNPECVHMGDILDVAKNVGDHEYFSFGCYSIDKINTEILSEKLNNKTLDYQDLGSLTPINRSITFDGDNGWYNHSKFRPVGYHFCSAITKKNLDELGGFDERFAYGIAYDDNEILYRIQKKGLRVKIIDNPYVIHQWHYSTHNYVNFNVTELIEKNKKLYNNVLNNK